VFVNRRPVENRGLNYALFEGYHTSLMKGRYPVCCLFLELDPALVDVNVHPAKREVKFRNENHVRGVVAQAVRNALLRFHTGQAPAVGSPRVTPVSRPLDLPRTEPQRPDGDAPLPIDFGSGPRGSDVVVARPEPAAAASAASSPTVSFPAAPSLAAAPPRPLPPSDAPPVQPPHPQGEDAAGGAPLLQIPLRLLGIVGRLYAVFESDRGMVLMDQHAAHERVLYEQMLDRMERSAAPSQRLLLPETVELGARDAQFLRENLDQLSRLGVGLSEFGDRTFLLDALPPFVKAPNAKRFVLELVDELMRSGRDVNPMRLGENTIAKTVCRHAVKAHDPLTIPELENLVSDLRACAMPYTCPHGRPTLLEMSYRDLEKRFGRVT
jgi:DNA mismatch repair protein MutL